MSAHQFISNHIQPVNLLLAAAFLLVILAYVFWVLFKRGLYGRKEGYIVQANDISAAIAMVELVDGEVTHELKVINAVSTKLTDEQLNRLQATHAPIRIYKNNAARIKQKTDPSYKRSEPTADHTP